MSLRNQLMVVGVFSVAMGYLESSVVVYMREILYPGGFTFPLAPIPEKLAVTELFREAATLIMLAGIAYVNGKNLTERFAWFIYSFAIWDIFYYLFLKLLLNWPDSLLTWDILFLIPVTWTGPVIGPIIVSLLMILLALVILKNSRIKEKFRFPLQAQILMFAGAGTVFVSFIADYSRFILEHYSLKELWSLPSQKALYDLSLQYMPAHFPWVVFGAGAVLLLLSAIVAARK
ncbi:MAG: hypothetical protein ACPLXM_03060 [Bacteroidales bacterium]